MLPPITKRANETKAGNKFSEEILVKIANVDQMIPRMMRRIKLLFFS